MVDPAAFAVSKETSNVHRRQKGER